MPQWYSSIHVQRGAAPPAASPPIPDPPIPDRHGEEQTQAPPGCCPPLDPGRAPGGRRALIIVLSTLVVLGAGVLTLVLRPGGAEPAPSPAAPPLVAAVPPPAAGVPPVPAAATGTATLSDPVIRAAKIPLTAAGQWCSLLSAADVRATTGFEQRGLPDGTSLCTHYLADHAGYLFVSDIPALQGAAHTVRGNSSIVYQRNPASCEVTVALNRGGGVLDIDLRGVVSPRVPLCRAAANLAARAFDRLPPE